jgi:hypothetical protein
MDRPAYPRENLHHEKFFLFSPKKIEILISQLLISCIGHEALIVRRDEYSTEPSFDNLTSL